MDNNMIHIDDLVRQRLRGGEEPERPGAWLSMRELLDKEMPVQAGYNWRRIMGYFTALLLLTTASVGGFHMYSNRVANTGIASGGGGGRDGEGAYGVPSGTSDALSTPGQASDNKNADNSTSKSNSSSSDNTLAENASAATAIPTAAVNGNTENSATPQEPSASVAMASEATASNSTQNAGTPAVANGQIAANKPLYASAGGATVRSHRSVVPPAQLAAVSAPLATVASAAPAGPLSIRPEERPVLVKHDTIERMELVYRRMYDAGTRTRYYRIDTYALGKVVVDRILPSATETVAVADAPAIQKRHGLFGRKAGAAKSLETGNAPSLVVNGPIAKVSAGSANEPVAAPAAIIPNAAAPSAKTPEQEAGFAAAGIATKHFRLWNAEKVAAAIDKIKSDVNRIQMYPGIMGGINASVFTPNALGGFQLGLTSLFMINEWWSLMLEPKYALRYNTGSSVRDDYKQVIDNSGSIVPDPNYPGYLSYTWTDRTIQHSFNYDIVNTIELPVMLRYHWGQWYSQCGVNLVYSSAIAAKEVNGALSDYKNHSELRPGTTPEPFIRNDHPNVELTDFGSRFGTGYVLSGGYMFSPAVYVDARITHTFWDNSKTGGAKQVSKDLLRTPSIQISVGYRFNAKK